MSSDQDDKLKPQLKTANPDIDLVSGQDSDADQSGKDDSINRGGEDTFIGRTIADRYEILSLIGRGGMSTVYLANHLQLKKKVAVKILHTHLRHDDINFLRFQQEARSASSLHHTNIISVYDFGVTDDGIAYLSMDYVNGESLDNKLDQGALSVDRFFAIFSQVCEAMTHAHDKNVIHRDLKPSNIVIEGETEKVHIVDFGIAKVLPQNDETAMNLTQTGDVFGSPLYMSPEQCQGKKVDKRSDIYSLGCVMYEALTNVPPLIGTNVYETISKQVTDLPRPLKAANPQLEHADILDALVLKALAKNPNQRYQSMSELSSALNNAQAALHSPGKALMPAMASLSSLKYRAQNKSKLLSIYALIVVLLVVAALALFGQYQQAAAPVDWNGHDSLGQKQMNEGKYPQATESFKLAESKANTPENKIRTLKKEALLFHITGNKDQESAKDDEVEKSLGNSSLKNAILQLGAMQTAMEMLPEKLAPETKKKFVTLYTQLKGVVDILDDNDEIAKARGVLSALVPRMQKEVAPLDPMLAYFMKELSIADRRIDNYEEARKWDLESIKFWQQKSGDKSPDLALSHYRLGRDLLGMEKNQEAEAEFNKANEIFLLPQNQKFAYLTAPTTASLGEALAGQKKYKHSIDLFKKSEDLYWQYAGTVGGKYTPHPKYTESSDDYVQRHILELYLLANDKPKAEEFLNQSISDSRQRIKENAYDWADSLRLKLASTLYLEGDLFYRQTQNSGEFRKAESPQMESLEIRQHLLNPETDQVMWTLKTLAVSKIQTQKFSEAIPLLQELIGSQEREGLVSTSKYGLNTTRAHLAALNSLAYCYLKTGQMDLSKRYFERLLNGTFAIKNGDYMFIDEYFYALADSFMTPDQWSKLEQSLEEAGKDVSAKTIAQTLISAQRLDDLGHIQFTYVRWTKQANRSRRRLN